jgi:hypothetical protein
MKGIRMKTKKIDLNETLRQDRERKRKRMENDIHSWVAELGLCLLYGMDDEYFIKPNQQGVSTLCYGSLEKVHAYLSGRLDQRDLMNR